MFSKIIEFIKIGVWTIPVRSLSRGKSFWIRHLRIVILALRGFNDDNCSLRASALTFYSLLSIVPIVAMAFGIAKGFGFQKLLENKLYLALPGQNEIVEKIISFAQAFLDKTQGGLIAGIGIIILFWTIIKVLGNIEQSFNKIWGIRDGRSIYRKFSDYLSMMLVLPVIFIFSSSVSIFVTDQAQDLILKYHFLSSFAPTFLTFLKVSLYGMVWLLFTFLYMFMPNTKVGFRPALTGGVISGTAYLIVQWAYVKFQIGAASYGAIYGSFAALPLFLVWLQISWYIVLLGAEISFAYQNVDLYEYEPYCMKSSHHFRRLVALRIVEVCFRNFLDKNSSPLSADVISKKLQVPVRLITQAVYELVSAGVLSETKRKGRICYQPAKDMSQTRINDIIKALDYNGNDQIPLGDDRTAEALSLALTEFTKLAEGSNYNKLLNNLD